MLAVGPTALRRCRNNFLFYFLLRVFFYVEFQGTQNSKSSTQNLGPKFLDLCPLFFGACREGIITVSIAHEGHLGHGRIESQGKLKQAEQMEAR